MSEPNATSLVPVAPSLPGGAVQQTTAPAPARQSAITADHIGRTTVPATRSNPLQKGEPKRLNADGSISKAWYAWVDANLSRQAQTVAGQPAQQAQAVSQALTDLHATN